ncbi:MAG: hypothetical protein P9M06_06130 [Candidatus Saelkia tenebricola]|nr:hypothetical protein [Candidatus Saelkia tenebricola]
MKKLQGLMIGSFFGIILITGCAKQEQSDLETKETSEALETNISQTIEKTKTAIITSTATEAINIAKTLDTKEEKLSYLVTQASNLYNSEKFQDVIDIAQYILTYLDKNSHVAKNLFEKATSKLTSLLKEKASDYTQKLNSFGQ